MSTIPEPISLSVDASTQAALSSSLHAVIDDYTRISYTSSAIGNVQEAWISREGQVISKPSGYTLVAFLRCRKKTGKCRKRILIKSLLFQKLKSLKQQT